MIRILILANNDIGLYNFRRELLEELLLQKYEVHIALPYGSFVEHMTEMGCIFHDTKMERRGTNPFRELFLLATYRRLLKEISPEAVLTYTIKPNLYGGILCGLYKISYLVNITGLGTAVEGNGLLQKFTMKLYGIALKRAACVFFQNKTNEQLFTKKKIAIGNHRMVPGSGVNLMRYPYLAYPTHDKVEFLFISRVLKEKGIEQYLDLAESIKPRFPNTEFHILGFLEPDYEGKERLERLDKEGIVQFQGMIKDITPFLLKSQCTIHPSFYPEGMSNVCLESAASGRPVITTRRPGCMDTVEEGVTGLLVREQDSQDLIKKTEQFLNKTYDERREMGIRARKKMEKQFDRNIVIQIYLEELKKVQQTIT